MGILELLASNNLALGISAAILGLIVGSFLNVVIYRLPVMLETDWRQQCHEFLEISTTEEPESRFDLMQPASHCPHCKSPIAWYQNIPVVSYLLQRGRCGNCDEKISIRYPLVELLTAILTCLVALKFGPTETGAAAILLTWVLISLALIDYDTQLLPDNITLPMIWLGLLLSLFSVFVDAHASIVGAIAGYMLLWIVFQLFKLVTGKEGMGYGDFKLLALLGAWLGWQMIPLIILMASLAGAILGVLLILFKGYNKEKPIPFGPYLAIAGWLSLMFGGEIIAQYWQISS